MPDQTPEPQQHHHPLWKRIWVRTRMRTYIAVHCMQLSSDRTPNEHGHYQAWFCDPLRFHPAPMHRDSRYPRAVWLTEHAR